MKKRSKALFVSGILGTAYAIYIVFYFYSAITSQTDASSALGASVAAAIITPHMICAALAAIFNWIGWGGSVRWAALVGGIMYSIAAIVFLLYIPFVLLQIILSFVGFARLKKLNALKVPA